MADADKHNASVNANESASIDDELASALNGLAETLPQNGRGASAEPESDDADDDTAGESTDVEENGADDDEGDDAGETDDDGEGGQTDTDDASADDDTAKASAGEPAKEPVKPAIPSKEERIKERKLAALEKALADSEGITIYEKIAEATGETEEEVRARIESDDLTTEEKAALYDREHTMSEAERREADGKKFFDGLLAEIHEAYPETKDVVKTPKDLDDEETFRLLILSGKKSAVEAFRMTNGSKIRRTAPPPSGKGHLQPDVHSRTKGSATSMSAEEITTLRNLFPGMKDREIEQLRRKVNS